MIKSKKIKVLIISILCILTITFVLSYGYYLLNKVQENNNIAGSKCFNLEFTNEKNAINLDNMYPISDEDGRKLTPYSFTITNTCDILAGYTVNMEMLEGTTLNSKYLDVMVNNEQIKLLTNYESTNTVITGSTESRILAKGTLAHNDSVDYTVRFWMDKDVEDTESMNKLFKSKIVISATPSSWNPKDAGYDTLHDAILANEYQTTPEDATGKIEAKGEPDLSNTAPIIKWIEKAGESTTSQVIKPAKSAIKSDDQTSNLTENDTKLRLFKTKLFNSDTSTYTLEDPVYIDPTTLNFDDNQKYYFQSENIMYNQTNNGLYTSSRNVGNTVYQITGATKTNGSATWNGISYDSIIYKLNLLSLNGNELETDKSDKGLYQATDELGTTYYYRGNVGNNNVYFAGFYWQIIRINGDGSIRIIYNGAKKNAKGVEQSINSKAYRFNELNNKPAYVGYMYGNPDGVTYNDVYANINNSTVKSTIDGWYAINIKSNNYDKFISLVTGFCGDRSLYGGDGISTSNYTYFGTYGRYEKNLAKFACPNIERDLYTTTNANIGNNSLTYPVGLITYDELVYSGLDSRHINKLSWSYSSENYWTMSAAYFSHYDGKSYEWINSSGKMIYSVHLSNWYSARPVINLKSDVKITGGIGTSNDPYVIDTSK